MGKTIAEVVQQACPQGLTREELESILGDRLPLFDKWMSGQTMSLCDGLSYHHDMTHGQDCMTKSLLGDPPHTEESEFTWRCDYTGTGHYELTQCAGNPHGPVVYPSDLERFMEGKLPAD